MTRQNLATVAVLVVLLPSLVYLGGLAGSLTHSLIVAMVGGWVAGGVCVVLITLLRNR